MHDEALALREPGDLGHLGRRRVLVGGAAPVEGHDRVLVLAAHAQPLALRGHRLLGKRAHARRPRHQLGVDLRLRRPRAQQFPAVVADVGDRPDRHDLARGGCAAAADAGDHAVALGDLDQQRARGLGDVGVVGMTHDRGERAVDVQQHRGAAWIGADRLERLHERGSGGHGV